jgi:hypothetical protein
VLEDNLIQIPLIDRPGILIRWPCCSTST